MPLKRSFGTRGHFAAIFGSTTDGYYSVFSIHCHVCAALGRTRPVVTCIAVGAAGTEGHRILRRLCHEKALSVDTLFVFLVIMASFKVPREDPQKVVLFGIVFSLVLGGAAQCRVLTRSSNAHRVGCTTRA